MRLTLAEKILSSRCVPQSATHDAESPVRPGDLIEVAVDLVLANDITAPIAIREFETLGIADVFDSEAIVLVADHFTPNKDIASAEQVSVMRRFAKQQAISQCL